MSETDERELREEIIFEFEAGHTNRAIQLCRDLYPEYLHDDDTYIEKILKRMVDYTIRDDYSREIVELQRDLAAERALAERLAIVVNQVASCQFEEMYTSITPNVRIYINRDVMMLARELADDSADDGGAA